eukprot:SAG31_NODE_13802_length_846_cov_0.902276_1_plen_56_part_00
MASHVLETEAYINKYLKDRALVVTYEQLSENLELMLHKIARFLGVALGSAKLQKN